MLEAIAAFNASAAIIKEAIGHGQDLVALGKQCAAYFDAEAEIAKAQQKNPSDTELFFAREKQREFEQELKEMFIYQGRPGLWNDWLAFKVARKKERERQERLIRQKVAARRQALYEWSMSILIVLGVMSGLIVIGFIIYLARYGSR